MILQTQQDRLELAWIYLRVSIHQPPSTMDLVPFLPDPFHCLAKRMVGREILLFYLRPSLGLNVRAQADVLITHLVDWNTSFGPDDGVDATNFVGTFPGALENPSENWNIYCLDLKSTLCNYCNQVFMWKIFVNNLLGDYINMKPII